jgi:hypothetical protein
MFIAISFLLFWTVSLMADITSQTLHPALNPYYQTVEDAQLWLNTDKEKVNSLFFVGMLNTVDSPIVGDDGTGKKAIVRRTSSLQLGGAWLVAPGLQIGTDFGLSIVEMANHSSYAGISDLHFMAKKSLLQRPNDWGLSLVPDFYVPIHNEHSFISNGSFGFGGRFIFEKNFDRFSLALNAGYLRFPSAHYSVVKYSTQFPTGFGLRIPLGQKVALNIEGTSAILPDSTAAESPGDLYVGTRVSVFSGGTLNVGGAYGKIKIDNSASVRLLAGLDVLPYVKESIKTITREKETHTLRDCNPKSYVIQMVGRDLTDGERKKIKTLPFTETESFKTVALGQPTGNTKNGISFIHNSQVVFAVDLSAMPFREDLISVDSFSLKMKVNRKINLADKRSGMLCLIKEKICSGDFSSNKNYVGNVNSDFFGGREPPNDFFIRSIRGEETDEVVTSNLDLPFKKILENSISPDILNILYNSNGERLNTIYFAIARDIYVLKTVHIEAAITISSCITSDTTTVDGK